MKNEKWKRKRKRSRAEPAESAEKEARESDGEKAWPREEDRVLDGMSRIRGSGLGAESLVQRTRLAKRRTKRVVRAEPAKIAEAKK